MTLSRLLLFFVIAGALAAQADIAAAQNTVPVPPAQSGPNGPPSTAPPATSKTSPPEKIDPSTIDPSGPSSSEGAAQGNGGTGANQGVITPPPTGDSAIEKPAPNQGPNSMPVINPPANSQTEPK
jgi:hypothetical protein